MAGLPVDHNSFAQGIINCIGQDLAGNKVFEQYFLAIGIIALDDDMVGLLGGSMCDEDFILELWFTFTGPIFLDDTVCLLDCRRV